MRRARSSSSGGEGGAAAESAAAAGDGAAADGRAAAEGAAPAEGAAAAGNAAEGTSGGGGSQRTKIALLATAGVGVLVVAGVTIGTLGASGNAGHATTVSDRHSSAAQAGRPRRCGWSP